MEKLPDDLVNRASVLFVACLRYTVEMLTWEQSDSLPDSLQPYGELYDTYNCMLFNDEVHTYEQVLNHSSNVWIIWVLLLLGCFIDIWSRKWQNSFDYKC